MAIIVSLNVIRRHLDESQRALIAARMANQKDGGDRKSNHRENSSSDISNEKAARSMNVSTFSVKAAKKVLKEGGPGNGHSACVLRG
jgi:hypothetical protein